MATEANVIAFFGTSSSRQCSRVAVSGDPVDSFAIKNESLREVCDWNQRECRYHLVPPSGGSAHSSF